MPFHEREASELGRIIGSAQLRSDQATRMKTSRRTRGRDEYQYMDQAPHAHAPPLPSFPMQYPSCTLQGRSLSGRRPHISVS